ncbi:MAG: CoA transferase [Phaeodactylibacter sp.]|nr:CoA transferase [Phaeodactylibacter sp.]MCB9050142.1 CoA transferase [Lewinellaceae bacterium]
MDLSKFFEGLKVVELASVLAGPAVGMFFAELGAEVIKVENPTTGGDVTRRWKLPNEEPDAAISAYYCSVNYRKKVRFINLKTTEGQEAVYDLAKEADIIISNYTTKDALKLGMGFKTLSSINPRLIYAHLTGFGEEVERPAFDVVLQAEAGYLFMSGERGRDPSKMPVALIDILAAHQLKEAILLALLRRQQTGQGAYVSTSLLESAIASLANQATNWLMAGFIPQPMGSQHPNIAPYGDIFLTRDNKALVIAAGTERQFQTLCRCLELPGLPTEERFSTNALRVKNREALNDVLSRRFREYTREEALEVLLAEEVPVGCIRNMEEVFEQPKAQAMVLEERLPGGERTKRVRTVAFRLE